MPVNTPTITSNGGGATASIDLNEGITAVTTVVGNDADGDALNYAIVGGADRFKFDIDKTTGVLTFKATPDFEAPTDTDENGSDPGGRNTYTVTVRVYDGVSSAGDTLFTDQTITVNILDVEAVTITGSSGADDISPTSATVAFRTTVEDDIINGGDGADTIDGGLGADTMTGGNGNDTYYVDNVGDVVIETLAVGSGNNDQVFSSVSFSMGDATSGLDNLTLTGTANINGTGNTLDNVISGNNGANILNGGTGSDTLIGGLGNDVYVTDGGDTIVEGTGQGTDRVESSVTNTLGANLENLTLTGTGNIEGTGNELKNLIVGNSGNNILNGLGGDDELNGGVGADVLVGGLGNDTYVVDNTGDTVIEVNGEGTDIVEASVTYTLTTGIENMLLTGTTAINGTGNGQNNKLTGNAAANTLDGKAGDDILDGKAGNDTMKGGAGNDTYYIDSLSDSVSELDNLGFDAGGKDTVISAVSGYTLGAFVENLTLGGSAAVGTGNSLNNTLKGNSAANTLNGGDGNDTLDGLGGVDTMVGGNGNDTYIVGSAGETITEAATVGAGDSDLVKASVTIDALAANVENLTLTGLGVINGTGNSLDNLLNGNARDNTLTGLAGNDTMKGKSGNDTMVGGDGDDTYYVEQAGDVVTEASTVGSGTDTVISKLATYTLAANVETLVLAGRNDIAGTGNGDANTITGNAGWNKLDGGAGDDVINGLAGKDTITGGLGKDTMTGGADIDTFDFNLKTESGSTSTTADIILDFATGEKIDVSGIDAREGTGTGLTGDQAFTVIQGSTAIGNIDWTISGGVATLRFYTDSIAGVDMMLKVTLDSGQTTMSIADFVL
ncbi:beta strand repeat-containing protein [Aestuariivirga sp.]|uniref:beta strand repeat-containing protein n=1 Tax=Aestuariivirga sp. TaxID=2650926 RepID=UPI0035938954